MAGNQDIINDMDIINCVSDDNIPITELERILNSSGLDDSSQLGMNPTQAMGTDESQTRRRKGKKKIPKAPKKYEQTTPFEDKTLELQRINAIKAKDYREKKKRTETLLLEEKNRLQQELMNRDQKLKSCNLFRDKMIEEINSLRQENYQLKVKLWHVKK